MRRLTPLSWAAIGLLVLLIGSCLVLTRCSSKEPAPPPKPQTVATLPDESIGATIRDVADALRRWDEFRLGPHAPPNCGTVVTMNCVTEAERDKVMDAFTIYMRVRPPGKLKSNDPTPAPRLMILASRDLVVAIADCIEGWKCNEIQDPALRVECKRAYGSKP